MKGQPCPQRGNRYDSRGLVKETIRSSRYNALRGLMFGAKDFIPERDLAVMLGEDLTSIQVELRRMEIDGIAERQTLTYVPYKSKPGTINAWRLKQAT